MLGETASPAVLFQRKTAKMLNPKKGFKDMGIVMRYFGALRRFGIFFLWNIIALAMKLGSRNFIVINGDELQCSTP